MTVQAGTIKGIKLLNEPINGSTGRKLAEVWITLPAYTASSDTWSTAAVGAGIAAIRRDNKTVTLINVCSGSSGFDTSNVEMFAGTLAVSTDAITGEVHNAAGSEINSAASQLPMSFIVGYKLT